jgi:hypothetical protein
MLAIKETALEVKNLCTFDKVSLLPGINVITNVALLAIKLLGDLIPSNPLNASFEIHKTRSYKQIIIAALPLIGTFYVFHNLLKNRSLKVLEPKAQINEAPSPVIDSSSGVVHTPPDAQASEAEGTTNISTAIVPVVNKEENSKEIIERFTRRFIKQYQTKLQKEAEEDKCSKLALACFGLSTALLLTLKFADYYFNQQTS